ncbi:MAG: hypothetical protein E6689_01055 [Corynebacterium striatum]|uniref:hypothetical protein n=1 Tax=Corynebacterium TaxID=1716 RepID=UPI0008A18DB8|nr:MULTISPECIES: hypothetical protein [Corynebacterium]MCK6161257.1 hypothetical protein [Corynebacterium simulans]MDU3174009.1 hypothetical protein [Corynebacterium striatum]
MEWWTNLTGALSQAMVQAPVWLQMPVLIVVAVPLLALAAWALMFAIDFTARHLKGPKKTSTSATR